MGFSSSGEKNLLYPLDSEQSLLVICTHRLGINLNTTKEEKTMTTERIPSEFSMIEGLPFVAKSVMVGKPFRYKKEGNKETWKINGRYWPNPNSCKFRGTLQNSDTEYHAEVIVIPAREPGQKPFLQVCFIKTTTA